MTLVDYLVGLLRPYRDMPELRICVGKALDKLQPDTSRTYCPVKRPECKE